MNHATKGALLAVLGMVALFASFPPSPPHSLRHCTILLSDDPDSTQQYAATHLANAIAKITSSRPTITSAHEYPSRFTILLKVDPSLHPHPQHYAIHTRQGSVIITGTTPVALLYGTYDWLESLGVRWYTPRHTHYPQKTNLAPPMRSWSSTPAFHLRDCDIAELQAAPRWYSHLRLNGAPLASHPELGGATTLSPFVHTLENLIPKTQYQEHPLLAPLWEGHRETERYAQRCLTHPRALSLVLDGLDHWKHPPGVHPYAQSVSQNDTGRWCQCPHCQAIAKRYGRTATLHYWNTTPIENQLHQSGLYLWFVNRVAQARPHQTFSTLAYHFTQAHPKDIRPRPNVIIQFCPIFTDKSHPLQLPRTGDNHEALTHLLGWKATGARLMGWTYGANFSHILTPFPDTLCFAQNLRLYHTLQAEGIYYNAGYRTCFATPWAELKSYLAAKLMWNPHLPPLDLTREWMKAVYGPAWKPMYNLFLLLHTEASLSERPLLIFQHPKDTYFTPSLILRAREFVEQARTLADDNPRILREIAPLDISLRYTQTLLAWPGLPAFDQLIGDARAANVTRISPSTSIETWSYQTHQRAATPRKP